LDLPRAYYKRLIKKPLREDVLTSMLGKMQPDHCNVLLAHNPDYFRSYCTLHINHNHLRRVVNPDMDRMHAAACGHNHLRLGIRVLIHPIDIRINNPPEMVVIDVNKM